MAHDNLRIILSPPCSSMQRILVPAPTIQNGDDRNSIVNRLPAQLGFVAMAMSTPIRASLDKFKFTTTAAAALLPILRPCHRHEQLRLFSTPTPPAEVQNYKLPPPVNPPDKENPDRATLRAQWDHAVRLYGRTYSHVWGTAILAGVTLFGIGWWVKGENPLKALDPTGNLKKEKTAD